MHGPTQGLSVYLDDKVRVEYIASQAPLALTGRVVVECETGPDFEDYSIEQITTGRVTSFTANRTPQTLFQAGEPSGGGCPVVGGGLYLEDGGVDLRRGQFYARLLVDRSFSGGGQPECFACGYLYSSKPFIAIGEHVEPGPGGGEGFLSWVSLAADIAPVDVTRVLAAANTFRRIHGFTWYYNCAAVVASRTLQVYVLRRGLAVPTGFTSTGFHWANAFPTLTTGEEGTLYVDGKFSSFNDNGTVTYQSTATSPSPFPLDVEENDLGELLFDVTAADAGDRHSIYLLQEEWLVI